MPNARLVTLIIALGATPAAAQRVVFTPPLDLPTADIVALKVRRATPNATSDSTIATPLYVGRLLAARADSLLIEQGTDTVLVAAKDVMTLQIRHFSAIRGRVESGSEVAAFGGAFGALAGWLGGVVARAGGRAPSHPVLWGLVAGTAVGFVLGALDGDTFAGYSWSSVQLRAAP